MAASRPQGGAYRRTSCNKVMHMPLRDTNALKFVFSASNCERVSVTFVPALARRRSAACLVAAMPRCAIRGWTIALLLLGGVVSAQDGPDRSKPPVLAPPATLKLPAIAKSSLSNGLAVWVVESHEVPIVQLSLVVRAGGDDDPRGKFGAASLTAAMLDEGAGQRSALEIADAIEFLGAALTTGSSYDASAVRLNVPVQRLDEALPLFADVAQRPTFPEKDVERLRQERLTSLLQARDDASSIAAMAFARIVFGPDHRYGTGLIGTETSLEALTADDLRAFHAAYYQPANATMLVVGDTTPDTVMPQLEKTFGTWRPTVAVGRDQVVPTAPQLRQRQVYLVDKPDAEPLGPIARAVRSPPRFDRAQRETNAPGASRRPAQPKPGVIISGARLRASAGSHGRRAHA